MTNLLQIANDGPAIVESNYWDSEYAHRGYYVLSPNAGTIRLLVPPNRMADIREMKTGRVVVISIGPWPDEGRELGVELLFDDDSDSPYATFLVPEVCVTTPETSDDWKFAAWGKGPQLLLERPAVCRKVGSIPCLLPL